MSTCSVSDLDAGGTGVLSSKFPLLRIFSMSSPLQHPIPFSSPTMPPSSRSEKLLRDALLRDEMERQQLSSPLGTPITPPTHKAPTHRRRHSHAPISSTKEDYTRGSFLFRTAMSNPRSPSPSPSSLSQGSELERHREDPPVRRKLFYGGDAEGNDGPQTHSEQTQGHQQHQQSTMPFQYNTRRSSLSASPSPSRLSSASSSPPPSPLCMKRRQEGLGLTSPNTRTHTLNGPFTNVNTPSSIGKTNVTPNRCGSAYPSQPKSQHLSHGQGEPLQMTSHEHEQALRSRLERALIVNGGSDSSARERDGLKGNEVGGEPIGWPWRRGRQIFVGSSSGSGSISASFNTLTTASSSASTSNSNASHPQLQSHPHTPQTQTRTHQPAGYSPLHTRTRSQTDSILHPSLPHPTSNPNSNSPRRNTVTPTTSPSNASGSGKLTRSNLKPTKKSAPLPLSLRDGEEEGELRLPTPPPTPPTPFMARVPPGSGGANSYVPSPSGTPTRIPVGIQTQNTQRKKEGGLEMRRPTQGPAASSSQQRQLGGQRQRDVTVTQARASTESCSTRTSVSSATSNSHVGCVSASGYCSCSSHSSLDGPLGSPHLVQPQSQSNPSPPSSPATTTKLFNARKASTQCRAIQGYVSFASVEGLGEPPLVGDELDGFGEADEGKGRTFLPLGVWSAALGWKRFLGGAVEVSDQNAAHTRTAICVPT